MLLAARKYQAQRQKVINRLFTELFTMLKRHPVSRRSSFRSYRFHRALVGNRGRRTRSTGNEKFYCLTTRKQKQPSLRNLEVSVRPHSVDEFGPVSKNDWRLESLSVPGLKCARYEHQP